jgi:hypothetical protein
MCVSLTLAGPCIIIQFKSINQPDATVSQVYYLTFVSLNMFRAPPRPSSGDYNCINSLWFYRWSVAVGALLVVVVDHQRLLTL